MPQKLKNFRIAHQHSIFHYSFCYHRNDVKSGAKHPINFKDIQYSSAVVHAIWNNYSFTKCTALNAPVVDSIHDIPISYLSSQIWMQFEIIFSPLLIYMEIACRFKLWGISAFAAVVANDHNELRFGQS